MDIITQGLLGALAAQSVLRARPERRLWLVGGVAGMAADLDVLFEMARDPMLGLHLHRHFTHSLAVIPIGAALVTLPFLLRASRRSDWREVLMAALLGYATHGLLDLFTSYGTVLLWPFSEVRLALDCLSLVDPLPTVMLGLGVLLAARRGTRGPARLGLLAMALYTALGAVQHRRALTAVREIAADRGHNIERIRALPLVLSNRRWHVFYEVDGVVHVYDATAPWLSSTTALGGLSYRRIREKHLEPELRSDPPSLAAFRRYTWFTDGWIGRDPQDASVLADMRYSSKLDRLAPMWGIRLRPGTEPVTELIQRTPKIIDVLTRHRRAAETPPSDSSDPEDKPIERDARR